MKPNINFLIAIFLLIALRLLAQHEQIFDDAIEIPPHLRSAFLPKADKYVHNFDGFYSSDTLTGNVKVLHDNMYFYCNKAIIFDEQDIFAYHQVALRGRDGAKLFSDSLYYYSTPSIAYILGHVILKNKEKSIYTDKITYYPDSSQAVYDQGGVIIWEGNKLKCTKASYNLRRKEMILQENVSLQSKDITLKTNYTIFYEKENLMYLPDSFYIKTKEFNLKSKNAVYELNTKSMVFNEPIRIIKKDSIVIEGDRAYFDLDQKVYKVFGNAKYSKGESLNTHSDTLEYYENSDKIILLGNTMMRNKGIESRAKDQITYFEKKDSVSTLGYFETTNNNARISSNKFIKKDSMLYFQQYSYYIDTLNQTEIFSEELLINEKTKVFKTQKFTTFQPFVRISKKDNNDTLLLQANIIYNAYSSSHDSVTQQLQKHDWIYAIGNVKFCKKKICGIADTLVYQKEDSTLVLLGNPWLWQDSTQVTGKSCLFYKNNEGKDMMRIQEDFFLISPTYSTRFFDQLKSTIGTATLNNDGQLQYVKMENNAEINTFASDDVEKNKYIALNYKTSSSIGIKFLDAKPREIKFYVQPKGTIYPLKEISALKLTLDGFNYDIQRKPFIDLNLIHKYYPQF